MATRTNPPVMTAKQQLFVHEFLQCRNATEAAKRAGYKTPEVLGSQLRNPARYPLVAKAIEDGLAKVAAQSVLDAAGVERYINTVMTFQPLKFFTPSEGGWLVTQEQWANLPEHVGQLIEECTVKSITKVDKDTGAETTEAVYWVRFVSKTKAMDLAAKHKLGEKHFSEKRVTIDWGALTKPPDEVDIVEAEIVGMEQMALPPKGPEQEGV